jgi:hypothetical protein
MFDEKDQNTEFFIINYPLKGFVHSLRIFEFVLIFIEISFILTHIKINKTVAYFGFMWSY